MDLISPSSKGQWYSTTFKYGTSQLDTIYLNGAVYLSIYWNVIPKVVKIHQNGGFPKQGYPRTFHFFNHPFGGTPMETLFHGGPLIQHPAIQDKLFGPCVYVCRRREDVWRRGEIPLERRKATGKNAAVYARVQNFGYLVGGLEHGLFFHILGKIIPTDFHIFRRGRYTTNQVYDDHESNTAKSAKPSICTYQKQSDFENPMLLAAKFIALKCKGGISHRIHVWYIC